MMGQVDPELTSRFARSCTDAAFGYARAASAAYAAMANQTIEFWAQVASPSGTQTAKSYAVYRPHSEPTSTAGGMSALELMQLMNPWLRPTLPLASVQAWWGLFPLQGNPSSWPIAYTLMTAGVPRDVALPAAEANIAAMEAADIAQKSLARIFSSYQSNGGHAVSHVTGGRRHNADVAIDPWSWPWGAARN